MRDLVLVAYSEGQAAGAEQMRNLAAEAMENRLEHACANDIRELPLAPPQPKGGESSQIP